MDALSRFDAKRGTVAALLQALTDGLAADLPADRVLLAIVTPDRQQIAARFCSPPVDRRVLEGFQFPLDEGRLFSRLLARRASLSLKPGTSGLLAPLMPAGLLALAGRGAFFAMSVFSGRRPLGLFYADSRVATDLGEARFRRFQQICVAAGHALERTASTASRAA